MDATDLLQLLKILLCPGIAPISTIASPWTAIASGSFGSITSALSGHEDSLAEKMLLLGYSSNVDIGPAIAWIDSERRLKRILRVLELACCHQCLTLMHQFDGLRLDLIVGTLCRDRRGERNCSKA